MPSRLSSFLNTQSEFPESFIELCDPLRFYETSLSPKPSNGTRTQRTIRSSPVPGHMQITVNPLSPSKTARDNGGTSQELEDLLEKLRYDAVVLGAPELEPVRGLDDDTEQWASARPQVQFHFSCCLLAPVPESSTLLTPYAHQVHHILGRESDLNRKKARSRQPRELASMLDGDGDQAALSLWLVAMLQKQLTEIWLEGADEEVSHPRSPHWTIMSASSTDCDHSPQLRFLQLSQAWWGSPKAQLGVGAEEVMRKVCSRITGNVRPIVGMCCGFVSVCLCAAAGR